MNRIEELRKEKRFSQARLGIEIEVSQEMISAYENGKSMPRLETLIKMRSILNANMDYILGLSDVRHDPVDVPSLHEDDAALLRKYHQLRRKDREKVLGYIDANLQNRLDNE